MNPNDILTQQQELLNQSMENAQRLQIVGLVVCLLMVTFGAWVVYMFYVRLRDIGDELRKLRIAYEMSEAGKASVAKSAPRPASDDPRNAPKS